MPLEIFLLLKISKVYIAKFYFFLATFMKVLALINKDLIKLDLKIFIRLEKSWAKLQKKLRLQEI